MGRRVEIWTGHSSAAVCRSNALLSQDLDGGSNEFQNPPNWSTLGRRANTRQQRYCLCQSESNLSPPQSGRPSYCPTRNISHAVTHLLVTVDRDSPPSQSRSPRHTHPRRSKRRLDPRHPSPPRRGGGPRRQACARTSLCVVVVVVATTAGLFA
jgi:hypothetical protein